MKLGALFLRVTIFICLISSCSSVNFRKVLSTTSTDNWPWHYDPGPYSGSLWNELFSKTPSYPSDHFFKKFGKIWYRGRLAPQKVKVLIIGQESGAEEMISHRAFSGLSGGLIQSFLNQLGINKSYLFLNSYPYPLKVDRGFLAENNPPLNFSANKSSLVNIVNHRHKLINLSLENNKESLSLIIAVGDIGKKSTLDWLKTKNVKCTQDKLDKSSCFGTNSLEGVLIIGLGGEINKGSYKNIAEEFKNKFNIVKETIKNNDHWLSTDSSSQRNFKTPFKFRPAAIPYRDFPFGVNWNIGKGSSAFIDKDHSAIQVYSPRGCHQNTSRKEHYDKEQNKIIRKGKCSEAEKTNIHYDNPLKPRVKNFEVKGGFDLGPTKYAEDIIKFYNQNYEGLGTTSHYSWGPQGIYRGRFEKAKVLILADQFSHDDMFTGRALTGKAGQYLQTFLDSLGIKDSYLILRTLPVDTIDLGIDKKINMALSEEVSSARLRLIHRALTDGQTDLVLTLGPVAREVAKNIEFPSPVVSLISPFKTGHRKQWQEQLVKIKRKKFHFHKGASFKYDGRMTDIPRIDLPQYTPWWMGRSGSFSSRAYHLIDEKRVYDGDYYKAHIP